MAKDPQKILAEVGPWVFAILRFAGLAAQVAAAVSDNKDVQKAAEAGALVNKALGDAPTPR